MQLVNSLTNSPTLSFFLCFFFVFFFFFSLVVLRLLCFKNFKMCWHARAFFYDPLSPLFFFLQRTYYPFFFGCVSNVHCACLSYDFSVSFLYWVFSIPYVLHYNFCACLKTCMRERHKRFSSTVLTEPSFPCHYVLVLFCFCCYGAFFFCYDVVHGAREGETCVCVAWHVVRRWKLRSAAELLISSCACAANAAER